MSLAGTHTPDWEQRSGEKGTKSVTLHNCRKCDNPLNKTIGKDYEDRTCKTCLGESMADHNKQLAAIKKEDWRGFSVEEMIKYDRKLNEAEKQNNNIL